MYTDWPFAQYPDISASQKIATLIKGPHVPFGHHLLTEISVTFYGDLSVRTKSISTLLAVTVMRKDTDNINITKICPNFCVLF